MFASKRGKAGSFTRLTKRPLGQVLIDGEFISSEDLENALEQQKHTNELLGELLVRMGMLDQYQYDSGLVRYWLLRTLSPVINLKRPWLNKRFPGRK